MKRLLITSSVKNDHDLRTERMIEKVGRSKAILLLLLYILLTPSGGTANAQTILGVTSVCPHNTTILSCITLGGVWSSSDPAVASIDPLSGVVTGVSSGTATITYTLLGLLHITTPVTVRPGIIASATAGTIACHGGITNVMVSGSGGTGSLTGTGTFSVSAGNYSYTVTDETGCSANTLVSVPEPAAVTTTISAGFIPCHGGTTTVTLIAGGGTGTLMGTGNFIVPAGSYSYRVTDEAGCHANTSVTISEPPALIVSSTAGTIACNGGTTTVSVSATGGIGPKSGIGSFTVGAGTYTYNITDAAGCSANTSVSVSEPPAIITSATASTIFCHGGTANVTITGSGGIGSLAGTGTFSVSAGNYSYTVTDETGCSANTLVSVPEPAAVTTTISAGFIPCHGGTTTVTLIAGGGTGTLMGTGNFIVPAGSYSYRVTDEAGCHANTSVTISEPPALIVSSTAGTIACNGGTTTVSVSATGGIGPKSGIGSFTVGAGTYTYNITDAAGCSANTSVSVSEPPAIITSATAGTIACHGGTTNVIVMGSGGVGALSGTGTFTVPAGNYTYTITDTTGCSVDVPVTVPEPAALSVSAVAGTIACHGNTTNVILPVPVAQAHLAAQVLLLSRQAIIFITSTMMRVVLLKPLSQFLNLLQLHPLFLQAS